MFIFIDLETTGLDAEDKICSIALVYEGGFLYELVNEGKKIPSEASAIHHITNEDIKEQGSFRDSKSYKFLQEHNSEEHTLIAHNSKFDLEKLSSHGISWRGDIIDTLRVSKHLIPECELFGLQFLRYELRLYRDEMQEKEHYGIKDALPAHNALSDAVVCKLLFENLKEMADEQRMKELSFKSVLLEKFGFGKYKGRYIEDICINDSAYAQWLLQSDVDEDTKYSINYYLQG